MILRNLTLKVQGNRTCTDSPIYLYQNDRNIHLVITLNNVKYEVTRDMYISYTIVKPNGDTLDLTNGFLKDGKVHLILESELFDGEEEVGNALCQIKLYDNQRLSSISLPPFAIHVLQDNGNPIVDNATDVLLSQDELKLLTENELALSMERQIKISELPTTTEVSGFVPVTQGDATYKLDIANLEVSVDLSAYATKDEVNAKADVNHTHEQYLTEHQDISHLALKTEIPNVDGLATETYVNDAIANIDIEVEEVDLSAYATKEYVDTAIGSRVEDGSNYATKSELASKSDINHTHTEYALKTDLPTHTSDLTNDSGFITQVPSEYVTESELQAKGYLTSHQDISHLALKTDIPSIEGLATTQYVDDAIANIDVSGGGDVDLSGYVTTTQLTSELNKKANTTHNHNGQYVNKIAQRDYIYYDGENQRIYIYGNNSYYEPRLEENFAYVNYINLSYANSTSPANQWQEFKILIDARSQGADRNIYFEGGRVFWEDGTIKSFFTAKQNCVYIVHLIRMSVDGVFLGRLIKFGANA